MSKARTFWLEPHVDRRSVAAVVFDAPVGYVVEIRPPKRTDPQNRKMHGMFTDIAKQELYLGRHLNSYQWKNLFISGHAIATGLGVDMVPGIEGEFCNIRESSATMSIARMSSVIEYTAAWAADKNVKFKGAA